MDSLSYLFSNIQNAQRAKLQTTNVPYSKFHGAVLKVLVREGYIQGFFTNPNSSFAKHIQVILLYKNGSPMIQRIQKVSRPGRRIYKPVHKLIENRGGFNCLLISSSQGILSDKEALQLGVGGEILCRVE